jgi:hypothetical protein
MLRLSKILLLFLLLLTGIGCKEISVRTKVNSDGSIERTYTIESDSKEDMNIFAFKIDTTWKITVRENPDSKKYLHTAVKVYSSPSDFQKDSSLRIIYGRRKVELEADKKFRWFYTYYSYKEVYHSLTVFNKIPMTDFFTNEEIKDIEAGYDSSYLKNKVEEWQQRNFYEVLYEMLYKKAGEFKSEEISQPALKNKKEELFKALVNNKNNPETDEIIKTLEAVFKTDEVNQWKGTVDEFIEIFEKELENLSTGDKFSNDVIMPGLILSTNARSIDGGKLTWKFVGDVFSMSDYVMYAESRTANVFAFIITAIIFVGIMILLLLPALRKRRAEKKSLLD